ncbi:hypothetical protein KJ611_03635 [Patescibacteria group bacterium]|nr:hypothetical protein [Patescibacteria group bacterium]MBU1705252.1 hypothetical protein [Patescibacteria group bacterium]
MDFMNFFTVWLSIDPPTVTQGIGRGLIVLFILMFLAGLALRVARARQDKEDSYGRELYRRLASLLATMGVLGMILGFMSFENIRFLGGRFWYLIWLVATVIWIFLIVKYIKKQVPMMQARQKEREEKLKYIPKPKRK